MNNVSFFCDFDATISIQDVGDEMFRKFGHFEKHYGEFAAGECNVRELNRRLCKSVDKSIDLKDINAFAIEQEIDAYFLKFVDFCKNNEYKLTIVSDGFDVYIYPIFERVGLKNINIFCNNFKKNEEGFYPIFFGADESCKCTTASCKRNVVLNNSSENDILVYIGDGMTDFCAAEHCDIVFAKSKLAAYCNENKIPHHSFKSFFDVIRITEMLVKERKFKQRNQAFLKRKSAFEAE